MRSNQILAGTYLNQMGAARVPAKFPLVFLRRR